MCGVLGGIGNGITKEMICNGLIATQVRGKDATGIYQPKKGITKLPVNATKFVAENSGAIVKDKMFISHCRLWTTGKPENNENNHPFEGEKFISVHNGTCASMDPIKEYVYNGECDSEVLHSYIETYGLEEGLTKVQGCAALLIASKESDYEMYIWRHNNPLVMAFNEAKNLLLMASTQSILNTTLTINKLNGLIKSKLKGFDYYDLREHELWKLTLNDKGKIEATKIGTIVPKPEVRVHTPSYGGYEYRSGYSPQGGWWDRQHGYETSCSPKTTTTGTKGVVFEDCPDTGYNEVDCKDCPKTLRDTCKEEAEDDIDKCLTMDVFQILTEKECLGKYRPGDIPCRTCVLRTMCLYEIEDNWDEDDWGEMYFQIDQENYLTSRIKNRKEISNNANTVDTYDVCPRCGYVDTQAHLSNAQGQTICPRCAHIISTKQTTAENRTQYLLQ